MDDDVLQRVLAQMSEDTRQLLDWEARRLTQLRRESGIIDMSGVDFDAPLCSGHSHDEDDQP